MRAWIRTRAAALALVLNIGVILGLIFGAVAFADAAKSPSAQAYAVAAKAGYAKAATLPAPPARAGAPGPMAAVNPLEHRAPGRSLTCLAEAVYYEARGESAAGRAAVAQVVMNRTRRSGFPHSVCGVVYQGAADGDCQFSFVCNGAMRGRREREAWLDARRIAARALAGHVMTAIGRAISFRAADGRAPSGAVRLGGHLFFT